MINNVRTVSQSDEWSEVTPSNHHQSRNVRLLAKLETGTQLRKKANFVTCVCNQKDGKRRLAIHGWPDFHGTCTAARVPPSRIVTVYPGCQLSNRNRLHRLASVIVLVER